MINATATLHHGGFLSALKELDHGVMKFGAQFAILTKDFEGFRMISEQVEKVFDQFKETMETGRALQALSTETGQSVADLMELKTAFANADIGADAVGETMQRFQEKLGGVGEESAKVDQALHRIGLSAAAMNGKTFIQQLQMMQEGFRGISDQNAKANIIHDLFGRGGGKMLSIVGNPEGLNVAKEQLGMLPSLMQSMAPMFERISVAIDGIGIKFQQLWTGILSQVAPCFTGIADMINRVDFTPIGIGIGVIVNDFITLGGYVIGGAILFGQFAVSACDSLVSVVKMIDEFLSHLGIMGEAVKLLSGIAGLEVVAKGFGAISDHIKNAIEKMKEQMSMGQGVSGGSGSVAGAIQAHVGHLQSVGGGGGFALHARAAEPNLQIRANELLLRIAKNTERGVPGKASGQPTHRVPC